VTQVLFYEKPGCLSNTRQKALLAGLGHRLTVRNLLVEPWTAERLRPFFGDRPVCDWFNLTAPRVRNGEVLPDVLGEQEALALMVAEPLLIRRPLIEVVLETDGQHPTLRDCGFAPGPLLEALGVRLLPGEDLQSCSRGGDSPVCPDPAADPTTDLGAPQGAGVPA
jgi:nitrogenase-associated protein